MTMLLSSLGDPFPLALSANFADCEFRRYFSGYFMDEKTQAHEAKKLEAGYKCEKCGLQCRKPGEPFDHAMRSIHIVHHPDLSMSNWSRDNLLCLCGKCAIAHHQMPRAQSRDYGDIIGRDNILTSIYRELHRGHSFRLDGQSGIGKTSLMLWARDNCSSARSTYFSCCSRHTEIVKEIAKALEIEGYEKKSTTKLETEIIQSDRQLMLFIDNIEEIKPQLITFLKALHSKNCVRINYAGKNGVVKENLKPLVWGIKCLKVLPLDENSSMKVAQKAQLETGAKADINEIVKNSRGNPGRIWASCRGEPLRYDEHVKGDEMNILPFLVVSGIAIFISMRYTGRASGATDIYLFGGIGMALMIFSRVFATK